MYKGVLLCLCFFLVFGIASISLAQDTGEQITITTYYPSPYGVYKNLRLFPYAGITTGQCCMQGGAEGTAPCTNNQKGDMGYSEADNKPLYCDGAKWQTMGAGPTTGGGASCNIISTINDSVKVTNYQEADNKCKEMGAGWHIPTIPEAMCIGHGSLTLPAIFLTNTICNQSYCGVLWVGGGPSAGGAYMYVNNVNFSAGVNAYCVRDNETAP